MNSLYMLQRLGAVSITAVAALFAGAAFASNFDIPGGELEPALNAYTAQSGVQLVVSNEAIKGMQDKGREGRSVARRRASAYSEGDGIRL